MATAEPSSIAAQLNANNDDPFLTPAHAHPAPHRYASYDNQLSSLYNAGDAAQTRRALEAHLKETERRIQDASQLGQTLLKQRKDLNSRLAEVENAKDDGKIGPELQKKLEELEKEYTEVGKESARTFLPKTRIISGDFSDATKSPSASVFTAGARDSPSKISAPSRRQRNQPANRVHDIEFATEISTSLLAQVRQLQAVLAEKDELLKNTSADKAQLEVDFANLRHRMRQLDESEQKYKDENWNLETQLQEVTAALKEAADRHQRLESTHKAALLERERAQRELDELKHTHGKLIEDHEQYRKHQDGELHTLRRNIETHEAERDGMHKKLEELTSQNTELTRAIAASWHKDHPSSARNSPRLDGDMLSDRMTPEDSPPPSPSKTPARNGMLESETLRSSLNHAHRMIQNMKNNIHREKTEKFELKRMLQDARDELEGLRNNAGPSLARKRKSEQDNIKFKKTNFRPGPEKLGASRSSQQEIIMDEDWEDHSDGEAASPTGSRVPSSSRFVSSTRYPSNTSSNNRPSSSQHSFIEHDSTDAFETANEREETSTDAFETGVEDMHRAESSDDLTETEATAGAGLGLNVRKSEARQSRPSAYATADPADRNSFISTASTSDDDDYDVRTPVQSQHPKLKLRNVRNRRMTKDSEYSVSSLVSESPKSFRSDVRSDVEGTPVAPAKNLMAELEGLSDEDDASTVMSSSRPGTAISTPSMDRSRLVSGSAHSYRSFNANVAVPSIERHVPDIATPIVARPQMVDSSMMTEPWEPEPKHVFGISDAAGAFGGALAGVAGFAMGRGVGHEDEPQKAAATPETPAEEVLPSEHVHVPGEFNKPAFEKPEEGLVEPTTPRNQSPLRANMGTPRVPLQKLTNVVSQQIAPSAPPSQPLSFATLSAAETEPVSPRAAVVPPPQHSITTFTNSNIEPVDAAPETPTQPALFSFAPYSALDTEPLSPETPPHSAPFAFASFSALETEPVPPPRVIPAFAPLTLSHMVATATEPLAPASDPSEPLAMSAIATQTLEPSEPLGGVAAREYIDTGVDAEEDDVIPGTDLSRPGIAFLAGMGASTAPEETVKFPPRSSSIRSTSSQAPKLVRGLTGLQVHEPTLVFEDEKSDASQLERPDSSRLPFGEVPNNAVSSQRSFTSEDSRPALKRNKTSEHGTQTLVSSDEIENMLKQQQTSRTPVLVPGVSVNNDEDPTKLNLRRSSDTLMPLEGGLIKTPRRPSSSGSIRKNQSPAPPLPPDFTQRIVAVGGKAPTSAPTSSHGSSSMGPPTKPASAYKTAGTNTGTVAPSLHSRTPSLTPSTQSGRFVGTARARGTMTKQQSASPSLAHTRRSSNSSFASELDERFNITRNGGAVSYPDDMPANTDPRMIQAITQTMIGEYLWKYTRKTLHTHAISASRHRRFFWVHPYTRTLYWSVEDPAISGKELRAKSVAIEAVRVTNDSNVYPPGLHSKSLVVVTPGREIVFTAPTGQRHETWFNALSYLLLRTGAEREGIADDVAGAVHGGDSSQLTREDVDEFNPQLPPRSSSRATATRPRPSLSSYNSRGTTRTQSPMRPHPSEVPTLAQRQSAATMRSRGAITPDPWEGRNEHHHGGSVTGTIRSLFGKSPASIRGSFSSARARSRSPTKGRREVEEIYNAHPVVDDSTEELRNAVASGHNRSGSNLEMENVRACCDGKHDVGSLSNRGGHRHTAQPSTVRHTHAQSLPPTVEVDGTSQARNGAAGGGGE